jgi:hypothetical protein
MAERGIGGTGAPPAQLTADRGIGGTGIVGIVTGFASICVDGLEVRFDKTVPVSINGIAATARQLRAGQLVVIQANGQETARHAIDQASTIEVRSEVSGPIEAVDTSAGVLRVAGQRVMVTPSTWIAGRFGRGNWTTVSGLRQADGTIVASRLDRARIGSLAVHGQLLRDGDTTRIGGLIVSGPLVATAQSGTFVSVTGKYLDGTAEVTAIDPDLLADDPAGYFGSSAQHVVVQAFVRLQSGMVHLSNGRSFRAAAGLHAKSATVYRNAIVRLERTKSGSFVATEMQYTAYRAQPINAPAPSRAHGPGDLVLPPDAPPGPPEEVAPSGPPDDTNEINDTPDLVPDNSLTNALISDAAPSGATLRNVSAIIQW